MFINYCNLMYILKCLKFLVKASGPYITYSTVYCIDISIVFYFRYYAQLGSLLKIFSISFHENREFCCKNIIESISFYDSNENCNTYLPLGFE